MQLESAVPRRSRSAAVYVANVLFAVLLCPVLAWGWGFDGHKIVAVVAADNLTPAAASHVAGILGVAANKRAIATAMEAASILPDTEFRDEDKSTGPGTLSTSVCKTGARTLRRDAPMENA